MYGAPSFVSCSAVIGPTVPRAPASAGSSAPTPLPGWKMIPGIGYERGVESRWYFASRASGDATGRK